MLWELEFVFVSDFVLRISEFKYTASILKIDPIFHLSPWSSITYRNFPLRRGYHLGGDPLSRLRDRLGSSLVSRLLSRLGGSLGNRLRGSLRDSLRSRLRGSLGTSLGSRDGGSLLSSLGSRDGGRDLPFMVSMI
jgi:hypothetical protein